MSHAPHSLPFSTSGRVTAMAPPADVVPNKPPPAHRINADNRRVQESITQVVAAAVAVGAQNDDILPHGDEVAENCVRAVMAASLGVPHKAVSLDDAKAALTTAHPTRPFSLSLT